ncbi:MAG: peptidyl-prolyl cis-trans isomerase [Sulfurimonas sp.]|uniref:peptidylprolyl isomerase n=1 Tax=Sulfurimonas sp. TaxID=2022749 RepID=UPI00261C732C|nr:peptidyl-prolyl cis-trans isomerase [Sulfurimonas sp.]MDD5400604.1 peptidyl-prolyl cis-trans isomerase [Sulfurimonas sp.]
MYKIFLPLLFSAILSAELINGVSVIVKGDIITLYDVKEEMRVLNANSTIATDSLIRKKLEASEISERKISVTSSDVYDDIKKVAAANKMGIDEFYEAVRNSNGFSSAEFKEKTKEKLLSQKLYSAIAYSSIDTPKEDEIKEYYELHKEDFLHPVAFKTTIYSSQNRDALQKKITSPMYNATDVRVEEQTLAFERISPELAKLLQNTQINSFTPIISEPNGSFVSFYLKEIQNPKETNYEGLKNQIVNLIMERKREQVLSDYFARLRGNAEIQVIREVK